MWEDGDVHTIPDIIFDSHTKTQYKKGRFFGKGGFAICYEITNTLNQSYAGKIISKKLIAEQNQTEKMTQEIEIHQSLRHKNVVGFYSSFEDSFNTYIVLELCRKRSLMELHMRRKALTEPETRFYMKQILFGVHYLHQNRIVHRDLKLGNLFLNDELVVKIGDFGLAAKIEYDGERKKSFCGTPNYIAPEILTEKGHSFEVDIWSMGCIMYALLIGMLPFEASSLRKTYSKIKNCDYKISSSISQSAKHMIMLMLQPDPKSRPKTEQLLNSEFIVTGYCPTNLTVSCLTMAPRDDNLVMSSHKLSLELNHESTVISLYKNNHDSIAAGLAGVMPLSSIQENFEKLRAMLFKVIKSKPARNKKFLDEMTDPAAQPTVWVSKWVDVSYRYGFGYQLSDEGVGVMFNDTTKLIMLPNGINVHYVDKNGEESYMTVSNYPKQYAKKMKLLSYFSRYMREHLIETGASIVKEVDSMSRIPHLHQWWRCTSGMFMQFNNGTVQINFGDHTKIIMCPLMAAITYIDEDGSFRTFRFSTIERIGCSIGLYEKMRYAYHKITTLIEPETVIISDK